MCVCVCVCVCVWVGVRVCEVHVQHKLQATECGSTTPSLLPSSLSSACPQSLAVLFLLPQPTDKTVKPKAHKPVEALSVMFVLAHLWMGYFIALYTKAH